MADTAAVHLLPRPAHGRVWSGTRRVRFGDVNPEGRVRLDALSTYLQDLASDDTDDAGLGGDMVWVVRRTAIEVRVGPRFLEDLELHTWCAGLGRRWAERRVSIQGARGASVEAAMLWVALDAESGRPVSLAPGFVALYGEAAQGREVSARLQHPPTTPAPPVEIERQAWPLRSTDFDLLEHVNNAAAWAMVEEAMAGVEPPGPFRAEIEYRLPVERGYEVELGIVRTDRTSFDLWAVGVASPATPRTPGEPADGADAGGPPTSQLFTTARVIAQADPQAGATSTN